jgi:group I intron endonuclease
MADNYSVYQVANLLNGKLYIGLTRRDPAIRWKEHQGACGVKLLHRAIKKYGLENFEFDVLLTGLDKATAVKFEIELISWLGTQTHGYNLASGGDGVIGCTHSAESKKKISEALMGRTLSPEHCQKLSLLNSGRKHTEEARANIAKGCQALARRKKLSAANTGKTHSAETRKKLAEINTGRPVSAETREKLAQKTREYWRRRKCPANA